MIFKPHFFFTKTKQVTPDKIEIPIPAYFKRDRTEAIAYWDNLLKVAMLLLLLFTVFFVVVHSCCCCCCCCCYCSLLLLFPFVVMFTDDVMLILLIADTKSIFITAGVSRKDGRPTREG